MARPTLTPAIVHAASTDAGNASMRTAGRTSWSQDDYDAAVAEYHRLMPEPYVLDCTPDDDSCRPITTSYYVTVIVNAGDLRGKTFVVESYLSRYDDSPAHRKTLEDAWREQHDQKIDHFVYPHHPVYTPSFGTRTADIAAARLAGNAWRSCKICDDYLSADEREICEPCALKLAEHEAQKIAEERHRDALNRHFYTGG